MLRNTLLNRTVTKTIAKALGTLNDNVVYVEGAVVSFYIDDPSAEDVRPTKNIDLTMEIVSITELEKIREQLTEKGFYQSHEDNVICRFRYEDIKIDVMSTKAIGWAPSNPWFEEGFKNSIQFSIDNTKINCLPLPYFLATKFVAFYDRGAKDPRTSQDFEDIVYLLNYSSSLENEVLNAKHDVRSYVIRCFKDISSDHVKQEAVLGYLFYEDQDRRYHKIMNTLERICG